MSYWLLSSGKNVFQFSECMKKYGFVYWNQQNKVQVDDLILIYISAPIGVVKYLMKVTEIERTFDQTVDNEEFWIDKTKYLKGKEKNRYFRIDFVKELESDKGLRYYDLSHNGLGCVQNMQRIDGEKLDYFKKIGIL